MPVYPLDVSPTVILDGSGNGIIRVGPVRVRESWQPFTEAVRVSTNGKEAQCVLYYGTTSISGATFMAQTQTGSTGDTCGSPGLNLPQGYALFAQWTGGDPGATATLHVIGTYKIGSQ